MYGGGSTKATRRREGGRDGGEGEGSLMIVDWGREEEDRQVFSGVFLFLLGGKVGGLLPAIAIAIC